MTSTDYSIDELEQLSGMAKRTIRFYIQKGLVTAPFGARRTPRYTQAHVEQLLQIKQFKNAGLNLAKIAVLLNSPGTSANTEISSTPPQAGDIAVVSRMHIAKGVYLDIDRANTQMSDQTLAGLREHILSYLQQHGA